MDYVCVDFSVSPIRAIRASVSKNCLSVIDYACAPKTKEDESDWLRAWLRAQKRPFQNPILMSLIDHPEITIKVRPTGFETQKKLSFNRNRLPTHAAEKEQASDRLTFICQLPVVRHAKSLQPYHLDLSVEIPREKRDRPMRLLFESYGSCQKISVLPLALWNAVLLSYPQYMHKTVATVWIADDVFSMIVMEKGSLIFYRRFPKANSGAEVWVSCLKTCIEQFSFSFPWASIDLVLSYSNTDHPEMLKEWFEGVSGCPSEWISPLHEGHVLPRQRLVSASDEQELAKYWPAMGLIYGHAYPWHELYAGELA